MRLSNEVFELDCTGGSHVYAVQCADGVTLIDTSMPGKGQAILTELGGYGIKPANIKRILLTHHDLDHMGSAAYIQKETGCEIYISAGDYPYLSGERKRPGIKRLFSALVNLQIPANVKKIDGNKIGEYTVIPTPGHTPGHVSYRFRDILFLGDLVRTAKGVIKPSPNIMTWNKKVLDNSIRSLDVTGAEWLCPAHGEPVKTDAWKKFVAIN